MFAQVIENEKKGTKMRRRLMTAVMLAVLALGTAACNTPFTQKTDDATEAISTLPEDVIKDGRGAQNAAEANDASEELIKAIEELPVDPADAVSGPDGSTRPVNDPYGDVLDQIESLPEDVVTGPESPADGNNAQEAASGNQKSVKGYDDPAFTLSEDEITGEVIDGSFYITDIRTDKVNIVIPEKINGAPVVSIAGYIFGATDIESVVFPDTLEMIGEAEFNNCKELKYVDLGKGLKYIGKMPFSGCNKLETVSFPDGMQFFDDVTFYSCTNLKEVYVPASATEFGSGTPVIDIKTCPQAVVVTPAGSPAQKICEERGVPVRAE